MVLNEFLVEDKRSLFHFNATCEMAIANGNNSFKPPAFLQQFEQELALLPVYLASSNDYLLINKQPSWQFLERLAPLKNDLPFIGASNEILSQLKSGKVLQRIEPWGWSAAEHYLMASFKEHCSESFFSQPNAQWNPEHKELYSRREARNVLVAFLESVDNPEHFIAENAMPILCKSVQEVQHAFRRHKSVVIKSPWSSSGRGMIVLYNQHIHSTYENWINGIIKKQGFVMLEPMLDKCYDLSFHFRIEANNSIDYLGQASFLTDENGQYIGNNIQALPLVLSQDEEEMLCSEYIAIIQKGLLDALKTSAIFKQYTGTLGVDVLLYRDEKNRLRFQPCLEINLRNNMGTVALNVRDLLHPLAKGHWQVKHFNNANANTALDFDGAMQKQHPVQIESGKIVKGYMPMIEPNAHNKFALYLVAE